MRLLTIGGGGNVGFWVEKEFLKNDWEVFSNSRGTRKLKRVFQKSESKPEYIHCDIKAPNKKLLDLINRSDVIIDFICFNEQDALSRQNLLSNFKGQYILISTVAVYDRFETLNILSSSSLCTQLQWEYAKRKYYAEQLLVQNTTPYQKKILRLGHTFDISLPVPFGPSDWTIPYRLLNSHHLLIHRKEGSIWPLLHASDAAKRIFMVAVNGKLFPTINNIVANETTSWHEIGSSLFEGLKLEPKFRYISPSTLRAMHNYWSDSVFFHKRYDERYVGIEQELFLDYFKHDLKLTTGITASLDFYFASNEHRKPDTKALHELSLFD